MSFERKHCIVRTCDRKNTRKFSLPSDTEGAKLWLELLGRNDLKNHRNTSNLRVCEAHFAPHMMTASGKRLVQWAIPHKVIDDNNSSGNEEIITSNTHSSNTNENKIEIKKKDEKSVIKPQIISINQITSTSTASTNTINNSYSIKNESHDVTEVLNFEIKDDVKSVIEKATIIKDDIVGKIDTIELDKNEVHTVIETLKVEPQIITINQSTIPTQTIQTISTIQNSNASTMTPTIISSIKTPRTITLLPTEQRKIEKRKQQTAIAHNHNKNKIRKSDLINLAQQAINEAKNPITKDEDQFDLIGKRIAIDLRQMDKRQKAIAEKLVNDVIYYGKIGQLRETSSFNPFYSTAPASIVSTTPTVIQTTVQSSNHQQQQPRQIQAIQTATATPSAVAAVASTQTIAIPPVGSLITANPIVSTVQVAGTNQIIYTVSNQNANASTININGQTEQTTANDKCQYLNQYLSLYAR